MHRETLAATTAYKQDAGLRTVDVEQQGAGADNLEVHWPVRPSYLGAASQADHAEVAAVAQAAGNQVEVACLEDLEAEQPVGKENGLQREERQLGFGGRWCHGGRDGGVGCRTAARRRRRARFRGDQANGGSSRWRISVDQRSPKRRASASTKYTERCWPPVQPIATVT